MKEKAVKISKGGKPGIGYRLFRMYVRIMHNCNYYRKAVYLGRENIPQNCPLLIVSNHQNSLNDALAMFFAINSRKGRKWRAITRADAFDIPFLGMIMHWLGLLPAFRLSYGIENLSKNAHAFDEAADELLVDGTVIIYPEAGHQDKRWLGKFTSGYLKLIFKAIEKDNFEKEMFILPSCNHYSDYFDEQEDVLIKFGKPISVAPYYEQYKLKPRTTIKELNTVVRKAISDMMLDITDLDNYEAIDFLRNTYGIKYARQQGFNPDSIDDKLDADRLFVKNLESAREADESSVAAIYDRTRTLVEKLKEMKIDDRFFDMKISAVGIISKILLHILLFPLYLIAWLANIFVFLPPKLINRKINDTMLHGSFKIAVPVLVGIPLTNIIILILGLAVFGSIPATLIGMLCLPFLYVFAIRYAKRWKSYRGQARYLKLLKQNKLDETGSFRNEIHKMLDNILKTL